MDRSQKEHLCCAGAFLCLGIAALILGKDIPRGSISHPGPGFFPFWVAVMLLILCGWLAVGILRWRGMEISKDRGGPPAIAILEVVVTLYAYVLLMPFIGFELATLGMMGMMLWIFGSGVTAIVVISVLASGISTYVFGVLLQVPLPVKLIVPH